MQQYCPYYRYDSNVLNQISHNAQRDRYEYITFAFLLSLSLLGLTLNMLNWLNGTISVVRYNVYNPTMTFLKKMHKTF